MDVKQCENGHFFDRSKYETCPVCGAKEASAGGTSSKPSEQHSATKAQKEPSRGKASIFDRFKKQSGNPEMISVPDKVGDETVGLFGDENKNNGPAQSAIPTVADSNTPTLDGIEEIMGTAPVSKPTTMGETTLSQQSTTVSTSGGIVQSTQAPTSTSGGYAQPTSTSGGYVQPEPTATSMSGGFEAPQQEAPSLADQIRNVSPVQEKTFGYFSAAPKNVLNEDAPAATPVVSTEPVVGWLVAIKGPHFGQSFTIAAGRNSIGRAPDNKICMSNDKQISREKHAWITYEPKKRKFFIQPGESSGLTYLNDDNVMETREISPEDTIEIGGTKLRFVPFCTDKFTWEDVMED